MGCLAQVVVLQIVELKNIFQQFRNLPRQILESYRSVFNVLHTQCGLTWRMVVWIACRSHATKNVIVLRRKSEPMTTFLMKITRSTILRCFVGFLLALACVATSTCSTCGKCQRSDSHVRDDPKMDLDREYCCSTTGNRTQNSPRPLLFRGWQPGAEHRSAFAGSRYNRRFCRVTCNEASAPNSGLA